MSGSSESRLLDTDEAARYLNVAKNTLNRWRYQGVGPRFRKLGRAVRYRQQDLDDFVEAGATETAEPPKGKGNWMVS